MTLGRSEDEFWRMTPIKLHALADLHAEIRSSSESGGQPDRTPSTNPAADLAAFSTDFA